MSKIAEMKNQIREMEESAMSSVVKGMSDGRRYTARQLYEMTEGEMSPQQIVANLKNVGKTRNSCKPWERNRPKSRLCALSFVEKELQMDTEYRTRKFVEVDDYGNIIPDSAIHKTTPTHTYTLTKQTAKYEEPYNSGYVPPTETATTPTEPYVKDWTDVE